MKKIIPIISLFLISLLSQAQTNSPSQNWQNFKKSILPIPTTQDVNFRMEQRLDSLYCYDYNIESQDYRWNTRNYYFYNESDLLATYQEQVFLNDGFGTWRDQFYNMHQYDEHGHTTEIIAQVFEETIGQLENNFKIIFTYENGQIKDELQYQWQAAEQTWVFDTRTFYEYQNNLLIEQLNEKYDSTTATWLNLSRQSLNYDNEQRLTTTTTEIWLGTTWQNSAKEIYSDWEGLFYTKVVTQFWNDNEQTWETANQMLKEYENGLLIKSIQQQWNSLNQDWEYVLQKNYFYDAEGELLEVFNRNWLIVAYEYQPNSRTLSSYFSDGQLEEEVVQDWSADSSIWLNTSRCRNTYDETGNRTAFYEETWDISNETWQTTSRYLYHYDSLNFLVQSFKQLPSGDQFIDFIRTDYERDTIGNLLVEKGYFSQINWVLFEQKVFEYNNLGQLESQSVYYVNFANNELTPNTRSSFLYQENGQVLEQLDETWNMSINTWQKTLRILSTYEAHGKIKRVLRQGWNNLETTWLDGFQTIYQYDENVYLKEIIKETWQIGAWQFVEKTTYHNDNNGQAVSADYQVRQDGTIEFYRWLYEFDALNQPTVVELQNRDVAIYDWVNKEKCYYFRGLPTGVKVLSKPNLSCLLPNPYALGMPIVCDDLDLGKVYQLRVYQANGTLSYKQSFLGNAFSLDGQWMTGLYLVGIFEDGGLQFMEWVFITSNY